MLVVTGALGAERSEKPNILDLAELLKAWLEDKRLTGQVEN